jgi:hypothetical protein
MESSCAHVPMESVCSLGYGWDHGDEQLLPDEQIPSVLGSKRQLLLLPIAGLGSVVVRDLAQLDPQLFASSAVLVDVRPWLQLNSIFLTKHPRRVNWSLAVCGAVASASRGRGLELQVH